MHELQWLTISKDIFPYVYFTELVLFLYGFILWYFKRPFYFVLESCTGALNMGATFVIIASISTVIDYFNDSWVRIALGLGFASLHVCCVVVNVLSALRTKIPDTSGNYTKIQETKE